MKIPTIVPGLALGPLTGKVLAEYRPLHQYLSDRFADTVVLSFDQIESLLGAPLPEHAHLAEWWAPADADDPRSWHARSWTESGRTARPNLLARNVVFERMSGR